MKRKVRLHPLPAHVHENEQLTALYQHLADTVTGPIKMALKAHGAKLSASNKGMWLGSIRKRICGELTSPSSITAIRLIFESTAPASTPTPKAAPGSAVLTVNAFIRKWLCDGLDEEVEIYENNPEFIADLRRVIEPRPNKAAGTEIRIKATIKASGPGFESSDSCTTAEQLLEAAVHHAMQVHGFGETKDMVAKFIDSYRSDYLGYGKPKPPTDTTPDPVA